jgi:hypothetical protein
MTVVLTSLVETRRVLSGRDPELRRPRIQKGPPTGSLWRRIFPIAWAGLRVGAGASGQQPPGLGSLPECAKTTSTVGAFRRKMRGGLLAVADRPKNAVRLSERLALSIPEAAKAVGVSERLMRTLPDIPRCHIGNRVVIPVSLLEEWLRNQAGKPETVVGKAVNEVLEEIQSSQ